MQIFGRDIRPRTALNRYGQIIKDARLPGPVRIDPQSYGGNANKAFAILASQPGIGNALEIAVDHPGLAAAALAGGTVVNNLAGNPVGGTIDFLSMGLTNLKPDEYQQLSPQEIVYVDRSVPRNQLNPSSQALGEVLANPGVRNALNQQPGMSNQVQIPELNEEERSKFMKYTTNRTAQQVLTYQALQDFLNQQPGMEGYQ
jgi:hypothetical protein